MTLFQAFGQFAGSGGVAAAPGMVLMLPSSIANTSGSATLGSNGQVTFSGVTVLSLNGCFTADFDNYVISMRMTSSGNTDIEFRLRAAGSDASGGNYTYERLYADGTTIDGVRSASQTSSRLGSAFNTQRAGTTVLFYGPFLAQPTAHRSVAASDYLNAYLIDHAGTHSLSTSYDGITFFGQGGVNITGAVQVYGMRS